MIKNPTMILVRGPIGSGKTSTVKMLREKRRDASLVEYDSFKRMIDNTKSSPWRQKIAFKTALYLTEEILKKKRDIILDIHSAKAYQYKKLKALAKKHKYKLYSFLLKPPIETCVKYVSKRKNSGIEYSLDKQMIEKYYYNLYEVKKERVFDSSKLTTEIIVSEILKDLNK